MSAQEPKRPQGELTDAFTGETFKAKARNHYETNDGVPVAPPVDIRRPTVRERVENLLRRGVDPLGHYVGTEGIDMDVPDEPDAPLTPSEQNYIDLLASDLAERAPLPDEGMPRPQAQTPPDGPPKAAVTPPEGGQAAPQAAAPAAPVPSR